MKCVSISFRYPSMVWPFFANIKMTLETKDTPFCRNFSAKDVEIRISVIVKNLENRISNSQEVPGGDRNKDVLNIE